MDSPSCPLAHSRDIHARQVVVARTAKTMLIAIITHVVVSKVYRGTGGRRMRQSVSDNDISKPRRRLRYSTLATFEANGPTRGCSNAGRVYAKAYLGGGGEIDDPSSIPRRRSPAVEVRLVFKIWRRQCRYNNIVDIPVGR